MHIVREATTNAVKHAQARRIEVHLFASDEPLAMRITNDGRGATCAITPGSGIPGMRQAAQHAGLEFRVASFVPFIIEIVRLSAESGAEPYGAGPAERSNHDQACHR